ncbi:hypothetical protein Tcan_08347 [Toxocara canis]|uniref:Activin_recp domain-containing protein n=1 Tax=Toxocara canis TaxID=6265 RepID=A0A0B2W0K1_TOXCA|nr:hypothetical protein Tcan_08347 [Toxocara canis]
MVLSSGTLKLIVLFAALACVYTLQCYNYYLHRGIGGYTEEPSRAVKCPKSKYCMILNGMIRIGPHSLRSIRERTCGKSKYVSEALCKESGCFTANFTDVGVVQKQNVSVPVQYCCCTGDLCNER